LRRLVVLLLLLLLAPATLAAAPLPDVAWELGDVPPRLRDDAAAVWERGAAEVQGRLWPFARAPQPITVHLMDSRAYAEWTAGWLGDWTVGAAGADWIALDVQRLRAVDQTMEHVLLHEYAHCLIRQGAGEQARVPRWFHEGAAQLVAREWRLGDTVALILDGGAPDLRELDRGLEGAAGADAFYRASLLAATRLQDAYGPDVLRDLVLALRVTGDFPAAFTRVTGESYDDFAAGFADSVKLRYGWLFLVTRWPTLFVLASLVFLAGAVLKRRRDLRRMAAMADLAPPPDAPPPPEEEEPRPRRLWPATDDDRGGTIH